ncbi:hypothetical protein [Actinopolymorpha rutila]|uniref:Uncharacterized protein n=1 Tax=Actinopolymorpha rutila TaxID=446787 RepID=A0A852Z738_9ACTN|nr:hypothetical protein [Actinopolymorpha rutila]NYH87418.1 hypothetical protein [Actinopolymorpha rutila]
MSDVTPLPVHGEVFLDVRGDDRTLRVNWHPQVGSDGLVVLSLWRDDTCVGSFRLRPRDAHLLSDLLARGTQLPSHDSHTDSHDAYDSSYDDADDDTETIVRIGSGDRRPRDPSYLPRAFPTHRGSSVRPPNAGGLDSRSA